MTEHFHNKYNESTRTQLLWSNKMKSEMQSSKENARHFVRVWPTLSSIHISQRLSRIATTIYLFFKKTMYEARSTQTS